jgi:hypothetical protein
MTLREKMLAGSVCVYRWLLKIHPKEFRAEHESEMVQHFRDIFREQRDHASPAKVLGLWGNLFLDLAASAAVEHLRRRRPMNTLDQDLRWDLRYGVQMFCKHSLWVLKYTALTIVGGTMVLFLTAWIWSGVRIWLKEQPVQKSWQDLTGRTPEAYFQATLRQFPKSSMNETARKLEEITTRLGIFNPMSKALHGGERRGLAGPFGTVDVPLQVLSHLRKPSDDLDEAPAELQHYLQNHRADLDALYALVQSSEVPPWVSFPTMCSLSPNTFLVLGERARVRGQHLADSRNSRLVAEGLTRTTKRETCHSATSGPPLPASPPESPKGGRFGGRGEELVGTLTQGGARGDSGGTDGPELLPSLALGYLLTPFQGFQDEAAASLPLDFFRNVQSPVRHSLARPLVARLGTTHFSTGWSARNVSASKLALNQLPPRKRQQASALQAFVIIYRCFLLPNLAIPQKRPIANRSSWRPSRFLDRL